MRSMVKRHLAPLDRFDPVDDYNPCEHCKNMERVSDKEYPCIVCIHNLNCVKEGLNIEMPEWESDGRSSGGPSQEGE